MRRFLALAVLALTLPLAACFDADVTADFTDREAVRLDAVMTMGADVYQMAASMGEDPCKDGVGTVNADGSYTCAQSDVRTLEALMAEVADPNSDLGMSEGVSMVETPEGYVRVSFDLSDMTADMPSPEERAQMAMMFGDAFVGHAITIRVRGEEIIETSGEIVDDGKTAQLVIPLEDMFSSANPDVPEMFEVVVQPGG
ncbi:hypothetical protein [Maritimibacter sp. DP1N21-5]|uniref:hypothetical protein n=1 Tax=Maritimibacter sp. DP1N21-5 TaxID=2836867 RepID=UPI001C45C17F|nr:hypothetical protein [Maritimibacter sp. DP1N21-5]MBV7407758.1 hypothetical protein [Maritimibacter sp. DP1N21-5]